MNRPILLTDTQQNAIADWLKHGQQSQAKDSYQHELGKSHNGYFGPGGWPYEALKSILEAPALELEPEAVELQQKGEEVQALRNRLATIRDAASVIVRHAAR